MSINSIEEERVRGTYGLESLFDSIYSVSRKLLVEVLLELHTKSTSSE